MGSHSLRRGCSVIHGRWLKDRSTELPQQGPSSNGRLSLDTDDISAHSLADAAYTQLRDLLALNLSKLEKAVKLERFRQDFFGMRTKIAQPS